MTDQQVEQRYQLGHTLRELVVAKTAAESDADYQTARAIDAVRIHLMARYVMLGEGDYGSE